MATKTLNDGNWDGDDSNTHKLNWTASNFDNFVYASGGGGTGEGGGDRKDRGQHTPIAWITTTQHTQRSAKTVAAAWALAFVITKHTEPDCDCDCDSDNDGKGDSDSEFRNSEISNSDYVCDGPTVLCRAMLLARAAFASWLKAKPKTKAEPRHNTLPSTSTTTLAAMPGDDG